MNVSDFEYVIAQDSFKLWEKEDFSVLGYLHNGAYHKKELKGEPFNLETRFVKFSKLTGDVICRPMEKFFNFADGLTEAYHGFQSPDLRDYVYQIKHDGSLINPVVVSNELKFFTKAGESEVATSVSNWMTEFVNKVALAELKELAKTHTVNMEFTSPWNRIVLEYGGTTMRILSVRNIDTGKYESLEWLRLQIPRIARHPLFDFVEDVPCCELPEWKEQFDFENPDWSIENWVSIVTDMVGIEGFVIRSVPTDVRQKVKTQEYVINHSEVGTVFSFQSLKYHPRSLLALIFGDDYDDILPRVSQELQDEFLEEVNAVEKWAKIIITEVDAVIEYVRSTYMGKKEFALTMKSKVPLGLESYIFRMITDNDFYSISVVFYDHMARHVGLNSEEYSKNLLSEIKHID